MCYENIDDLIFIKGIYSELNFVEQIQFLKNKLII